MYSLFFDGCSKGNPGIGGCGSVLYLNQEIVFTKKSYLGDNITNNFAEYSGLLLGLKEAFNLNIKKINIYGDSLLVINQITDKYKVNSDNLINIYKEVKKYLSYFEIVNVKHIYRNENKFADKLANEAIKL